MGFEAMEGAGMIRIAAWSLSALLVIVTARADSNAPVAKRPHMIVVVGAGGSPEYAEMFKRVATRWGEIADRGNFTILQIGTDAISDRNDQRHLQDEISGLIGGETHESLWIILIGHGTFQNNVAKFNLRGPDVSADELASWLKPISLPIVIVNGSSCSGPFINSLSGENRIVVTATKSGEEQNFSRFGDFISQTLSDQTADLDHDDEVSLLEAMLSAAGQTRMFYESEGRIQTEHGLLDDNGDRLGTPEELLRSVFRGEQTNVVKPAGSSAPSMPDGTAAVSIVPIPSLNSPTLTHEQSAQRRELELELRALRREKSSDDDEAYFEKLESIALKLAKIYDDAEKRGKSDATSP